MLKLQLKRFLRDPRVPYVFRQVNLVKKQLNSEPGFAFYGFVFIEKALVGPVSNTNNSFQSS